MKALFVALFTLASATAAHAVEVQGARINEARRTIEVDVFYAGGCRPHRFQLVVNRCLQLDPVQCIAEIVDSQIDDNCSKPIRRTVSFPLSRYAKYSGATFSIFGDSSTMATVELP